MIPVHLLNILANKSQLSLDESAWLIRGYIVAKTGVEIGAVKLNLPLIPGSHEAELFERAITKATSYFRN